MTKKCLYSNFFKSPFRSLCILKLDPTRFVSPILACNSTRQLPHITSAAAAIPEIKSAPPPDVPPDLLHLKFNSVCDFDTIPSEKPSDTGPVSPGPNPGPEFPQPPSPSPPRPEGPRPPLPSPPGGPEAFPPHGPDVIPPKPPEPGPPHPIKPEIPPPIIVMGSDGLPFY